MKDKHSDRGSGRRRSGGKAQEQRIRWSGIHCRTTVEKLVPGGLAMCRHEGQVVFVPGLLPGETAEIELSEAKGGYRTGRVRQLEGASAARIEPACPVYGQCGGCNLQHADSAAQLGYKKIMLEDCLRRQGGYGIDGRLPAIRVETGAPWGYRNRQQFHPLPDGSGYGFRQRESSTIVPIADCPVASPEIRRWLAAKPRPSAARPASQPAGQDDPAADDDRDGGGRYPVFGAQEQLVAGQGDVRLRLAGKSISFDVDGFFQSNVAMLERLIPIMQGWISAMGTISLAADLYCGCGVFAAMMPQNCLNIEAVDNNPANCRHAELNVDPLRTKVLAETVDAWLLGESASQAELYVLDPPRTGLSRQLLGHILVRKPRHLVFVSCDPVTFCRDLKDLRAAGYQIQDLVLLDFYPQTAHIETACLLELGLP